MFAAWMAARAARTGGAAGVSAVGADVSSRRRSGTRRATARASSRGSCGGDAELERLALALLAALIGRRRRCPAGPFPQELGPFTLERELGAGAHGKVFLARRRPLDGYVAVKLLRPGPGMSAFVEQVRREAGRARRHPSAHVVPVFDAGRIEGGPFYVEMAVCADPDEASPG